MQIGLFSLLIIFIDQITKFWVRNSLAQSQRLYLIKDYLYLTFVKNSGAAFGILKGQQLFFILVALFFLIFIFYIYQKELKKDFLAKIALIFLVGGSTANLIDRVVFRYVTDFIAFDLFDFYQLPVINIADIFIFFGIIILIYQLIFISDRGI